ncbi:MAG: hypothetical protein GF355_02025 [Candidatus Eisenbacteria bacterium]|nr:hypothetical protein [Candidatus Eisenbacteria bacterium]
MDPHDHPEVKKRLEELRERFGEDSAGVQFIEDALRKGHSVEVLPDGTIWIDGEPVVELAYEPETREEWISFFDRVFGSLWDEADDPEPGEPLDLPLSPIAEDMLAELKKFLDPESSVYKFLETAIVNAQEVALFEDGTLQAIPPGVPLPPLPGVRHPLSSPHAPILLPAGQSEAVRATTIRRILERLRCLPS